MLMAHRTPHPAPAQVLWGFCLLLSVFVFFVFSIYAVLISDHMPYTGAPFLAETMQAQACQKTGPGCGAEAFQPADIRPSCRSGGGTHMTAVSPLSAQAATWWTR